MAVAGLHNASPFASSLFGESKRASSLLKMWREIEAEHVESPSYRPKLQRNGSDSDCVSTCTSVGDGSDNGDEFSQVHINDSENRSLNGSETDHEEDNHSTISGQSSDLGETERERVRQIFREWMNTGSKGQFCSNNPSQEWLSNQSTDSDALRDGLAISQLRIGGRRPIRRLCGRQTLLDLLQKAHNERKRELLSLSEKRPVADFAHRNRIQALLRGRFLRNEKLVVDKSSSSVAATELGLLRQRHTVSNLREGFLSKLDNSATTSVNNAESDSSIGDGNNGVSDSTNRVKEVTRTHAMLNSESGDDRKSCTQALEVQVTEAEEPVVNEQIEQEVSTNVECQSWGHGKELNGSVTDDESIGINNENYEPRNGVSIVSEVDEHIMNLERNMLVDFDSHYEPRNGAGNVGEVDERITNLEQVMNGDFDSHYAPAQEAESHESLSESEYNVWEDAERSWQERGFSYSLPGPSYNNVEDRDQTMQESHNWPRHDLQEAIDSWLDMPSGEVGPAVGRLDAIYFPDDDNVHDMELRELHSRRRVSGLLGSSFRESLDQVLQSHVERLVHASADDDDWELGNNDTSTSALIEQNQQELIGGQTLAPFGNAERNPFDDALHPLWVDDLEGAIWPQYNSNQQLETDWGMINELRVDMARLHEKMNDMQNMLEACMDMQIELQRSLRQEVSAALNRSIFPTDTCEENRINDESQWDHVRKGICCLCRDNKIDSLLYRCGHMCTCRKCAEILVHSKGKCPMCRAPTVEAVRAYFNQ